jgi:hypothetical protein
VVAEVEQQFQILRSLLILLPVPPTAAAAVAAELIEMPYTPTHPLAAPAARSSNIMGMPALRPEVPALSKIR